MTNKKHQQFLKYLKARKYTVVDSWHVNGRHWAVVNEPLEVRWFTQASLYDGLKTVCLAEADFKNELITNGLI